MSASKVIFGLVVALAAATSSAAQGAFGETTPPPPVRVTRATETRAFSAQDLTALGTVEIAAVTPWTEGVVRFRGPTLATLADDMGVETGTVVIEALNDYRIEEPLDELVEAGAVIAIEMNGAALPIETHGPAWLTFPSAAAPRLATSDVMYRWIWQIERITFLPAAAR